MSKIKAATAGLKVLEAWGVKNIYGLPGGSFDSGMQAIYERKDTLHYVQVRHEEAGAIAASAEAKLTGKVGVTFGSAGPGAVHLLNGLYDAKHDHTPVVAIIAQVPTKRMNIDFFQAIDEEPIFDDVSVWNRTAMTAESIPQMYDEAIRQAYKHSGVAVVTVPKDLGWTEIEDQFEPTADLYQQPIMPEPDPKRIDDAWELIKNAKAPLIYFGIGAKHAGKELKALSEKFHMPMISSVLAKGIVEDEYENYLGSTGRVAPKPGVEAGFANDLVLWVGNDVPFSIFLINPRAKVIQIDIDGEKLGKRHHVDVAILADAKKALQALIDKGSDLPESDFYKASLLNRQNWRDWQASFNEDDSQPLRPEPVFNEINKAASDQAVFGVDVGNVNINFMRLINLHGDQKWTTSGQYATMGYGMPAAIAAKTYYPERDVFSLSGDGGFAMLCEEILTQVKYHLHIINIVFSNETLGFIEAEQTDDSKQPLSGVDLIDTDWAKVGEGMGALGITVRTLAELKDALAQAKATDKPVLIDVKLTHEMPFTTEHMALETNKWTSQADVDAFVKKYQTEGLHPYGYFLKEVSK
ncbi:pyruvate oxidase [Lactiplantibacillus mudanjiangensis]|uniref:Pyruvate oxidase n=1 Tax=Lactiplantibacillus mudanjiangensis TaxID=1296538 RepID=A0A660E7L5_9LACO|nr:pyruvate oxidase [Lactiplantibacillus mudanjiangensis]VDG17899.1 pyruvate oxidase [Lactobacillus sp.] [Lactiplantibacillus mudanjiangensis]VDG24326.1 pyruvate oxidase [Lactobacillus sp.] [Lactiplantibacillus mudanjiangensis]VDG28312.1 pyruvate oxidase [Lactobacillus sp.] [Lactiplantibacillus mudanjiangensis]VDG32400.1 pyruvate oxidase [Lactobacillus sp.] [Lactiplantibacillus mudanjiangensis]